MRLIVGRITAYEDRGWVRVVMKAAREFLWSLEAALKAALHRQTVIFCACVPR